MSTILSFPICRYYQAFLDKFLDGALSPRARRRLARHIDHCPTCYRVYVQRRDLHRDLQQTMPLIGRDHSPDFERMWAAVRTELPQPQPRPAQFRLGVVALMVLMALVVPLTMGNHELTRPLPHQPVPHTEPVSETPERTEEPQALATQIASATMTSSFAQQAAPPTLPEPDENP